MELWVRSQDKSTLSKITEISFDNDFIMGKNDNQVYTYLGQYNSKERCLEILDEVQKLLFSPTQVVFNKCDISISEYETLCKQLKTNGVACVPSDSKVEYLNKDWVLYEMPEK